MKKNVPLFLGVCFASLLPPNAWSQVLPPKIEIYPIVVCPQPGYEAQKASVLKAAITTIQENPQYSHLKGEATFYNITPSNLKTIQDAETL